MVTTVYFPIGDVLQEVGQVDSSILIKMGIAQPEIGKIVMLSDEAQLDACLEAMLTKHKQQKSAA